MTPIRIGLVGLGRAGFGMHVPELKDKQDKFVFSAACDIIPERLDEMKEIFPDCNVYQDIDDLLKDPSVELVSIATRSIDHFEHAKKALLAGKDVLAEKPMTLTYAQALELKKISDSGQYGHLYVRHNRRFEANFLFVKDVIASGVLGKIFKIHLARDNYQRRNDWQTLSQYGGGQLFNWGPHIVDHSLRLLESEVKDFHAYLTQVAAAGDCEDHLNLSFIGTNERLVEMEISGGISSPIPEYQIFGARGSLSIQNNIARFKYIDPDQALKEIKANPETPVNSFGKTGTFHAAEQIHWIEREEEISQPEMLNQIWDYLYDAIRNKVPFPITLEEAVDVIQYLDKAKSNSRFCFKEV